MLAGSTLVAAALSVAVPAQAQPNECNYTDGYGPWTSEADMLDAWGQYCRRTYVDDPGAGQLLSRQTLLNDAWLYQGLGFSRQWLWYAPESTVRTTANSPAQWSNCTPNGSYGPGPCPSGDIRHDPMNGPFGGNTVDLHAFAYDGRFIGRACGNSSYGIAGSDPVPTVTGFKFNDTNHNGNRDPGEQGLGGVTFQLIRQSSTFGDQGSGVVASTTSDGNGNFGFALGSQGPGVYTVHEVLPSDSISTTGIDQTFTVDPGIGSANVAYLQFGNRPEHPPIPNAGPDQQLDQSSDGGAAVTLDGTGSSDPDGDPLSYSWSGPFDQVSGPTPTVNMPVGTHTVTLTVSDGIQSTTDTMQVTVYPPITAAAIPQQGVEGRSLTEPVATFTDPDPAGTADDYQANIDWGDGTPSSRGSISKGADGTFTVLGSHTYTEEGSYQAHVKVSDEDVDYNTATVLDPVSIVDAALAATGVDGLSTNPVDQTVASFVDANPGGDLADFTATVDWGDGSTPTAGAITGSPGGTFSVGGIHHYATLGPKTITVQVVDDGGSQATAISHLLLYAFPAAGLLSPT